MDVVGLGETYQKRKEVLFRGLLGLHGLLFSIFAGKEKDPLQLEEAHQALQYRMEQMTKADEHLEIMDLPPPKGKACHEYDTNDVEAEVGSAFGAMRRLVTDREIIFPDPFVSQGRPFYKGDDYLVAAFHHTKASKKVMIEKLDALAARLQQEVEDWKEVSKRAPGVDLKETEVVYIFEDGVRKHISYEATVARHVTHKGSIGLGTRPQAGSTGRL